MNLPTTLFALTLVVALSGFSSSASADSSSGPATVDEYDLFQQRVTRSRRAGLVLLALGATAMTTTAALALGGPSGERKLGYEPALISTGVMYGGWLVLAVSNGLRRSALAARGELSYEAWRRRRRWLMGMTAAVATLAAIGFGVAMSFRGDGSAGGLIAGLQLVPFSAMSIGLLLGLVRGRHGRPSPTVVPQFSAGRRGARFGLAVAF